MGFRRRLADAIYSAASRVVERTKPPDNAESEADEFDDGTPDVQKSSASSAATSAAEAAEQTFNPDNIEFEPRELTRAMREAVWNGELGPSHFDNSELVRPDLAKSTVGFAGGDEQPKAVYWDPFSLVQQLGFRERPSGITYATLSSMSWRVPVVQAVLQTRINQASAFTSPQRYKFETGFRIKMRDSEASPTPADKKRIQQLETIILQSGRADNSISRDNFEQFIRKVARDSLTYDQLNAEVVYGRDGKPSVWHAVDASTIRLADTASLQPIDDPDAVRTVQIYDNVIIGEFSGREMIFEVRNPRTDIRSYGYGTAELEMVVSTVTAILWAFVYNQNFFSQGSVAKGLLNMKGAIPEKQLRAFRRQWYQMVSGVDNAWRTPITNAEDVQWINMHANNRDMEFSSWMDFLIKIVCLAPGTRVAMSDGTTKPIETVEVGDEVITHRGRPRRVHAVMKKPHDGALVDIARPYGPDVRATGEHPFLTIRSWRGAGDVQKFGTTSWRPASELEFKPSRAEQDFLVIPKSDIQTAPWILDIGPGTRSEFAKPIPERIEVDEILARFLGLYVAEGTASSNGSCKLVFHIDENEYAEFAQEIVRTRLGLDATIRKDPDSSSQAVWFTSRRLSDYLRATFGTECKLFRLPQGLMTAPEPIIAAFLCGLYEGDGYADGGPSITTASRSVADQIRFLAWRLGDVTGLTDTVSYRNGTRCENFTVRFTSTRPLANVQGRKAAGVAQVADRGTHARTIDNGWAIKMRGLSEGAPPEDGYVYNLAVDEDESYMLEGGVVAHNCSVFLMDPIEINFKYGSQAQRCYAPDVELLLYDGTTKRADQIIVGDQLMGPDSTPRNVLRTHAGHAEMYEIVPGRGLTWRCTGNHELTLINSVTNKIIDIRVVDYLDKPRRFRDEYKLFQPDGVDFPPRPTPELDPYFYGLWVGDGSKAHSQGVVVTTMDEEVVATLEDVAAEWGLTLNACAKSGQGQARGYRLLGIPGARAPNPIRTILDRWWADGHIADAIKLGDWETRIQFLAGFLDADGHLARNGYFTFVQKNTKTFEDVVFIARSLGYKVSCRVERSSWIHKPTEERRTSLNPCAIIAGPVHAIPTRIARKRAQDDALPKFDPRRTGFTVRRAADGPFVGFETDGDHRHLLADFTISHNSMFEGAQRAKSQESRERGLRPLLRFIGRVIDKYILWPIDDNFTIEFVGLEAQTPKELADLMTQRVRTIYTIDEIRAENDLPDLPDGLGKIILDANWMNARSQMMQQKREDEQAAQQAELSAQQVATASTSDLESMLAQLEGKTPKADKPGKDKDKKPGETEGTSTPAQTPKNIETELQGDAISQQTAELSLKDGGSGSGDSKLSKSEDTTIKIDIEV